MLIDKLQGDLMTSLKAKDQNRVDTIRLMIAELKNSRIEKMRSLTEEEEILVVKKMLKKLKEALDMFKNAGRADLVSQHESQIVIMSEYVPAEMSDDELNKAVDALFAEHANENSKTMIGIAMKALSSRAEPGRIMAALNKRM